MEIDCTTETAKVHMLHTKMLRPQGKTGLCATGME